MGSDVQVALCVLGNIPLSRIDQCRGSEAHFSGRYASSLPFCNGRRSSRKSQEMRCGGEEHMCLGATFLSSRSVSGCRSSLNITSGRLLTTIISTHFPLAGAEVSQRRGSKRPAGATIIRDESISALCSSIGVDATRKHTGQLPPSEYGSHMERCARRVSPSGRREMVVITAATADSDQTVPSQNGGGEKATPTKPHPEVHPAEVVQAQLKALRDKDLATVFEFASPANKARTGPLLRFSEMLEGRAYNVMIGHVSAEVLSTITISSNRFQQRVVIKGGNGKQATFQWSLSRQEDGPYESCWMTDAVRRDE